LSCKRQTVVPAAAAAAAAAEIDACVAAMFRRECS
jgi:hypothetical protein